MREITDTSSNFSNKDIKDGTQTFRVTKVTKKYGGTNKDKPFYAWELDKGEQVLMPNMMGPLLKVLGCKEIAPNKWDWDTEDVIGKTFQATVSHAPDKKDPSKIRQEMKDFKAVPDDEIPF